MTNPTRPLFLRIFHSRPDLRASKLGRWAPRAAVCALLVLGLIPIRGQRILTGEIEIRQALERLDTLGSVMMIGAHPDDEGTRAGLFGARPARAHGVSFADARRGRAEPDRAASRATSWASSARQELLAASTNRRSRAILHPRHRFRIFENRRRDLQKWPREKVLGDVVWNIRRFRPDVIILRFSGTPRDGHGHHQVSAILGREAFSLAADPTKFPEQLEYVQTWQAKRLMMNAGFPAEGRTRKREEKAEETPPADRLEIDRRRIFSRAGLFLRRNRRHQPQRASQQGQGAAEPKDRSKVIWSPSPATKPPRIFSTESISPGRAARRRRCRGAS